ncbi:sigma-54 interaction domain-containing protein [Desulfobaculum sp. SPO524]|uniref:sigma-54 interaction domain-containing protein n=1 Tax=Desulfobaculum sp. SPO524 TaxID=3378071 RepID=UPI003855402C
MNVDPLAFTNVSRRDVLTSAMRTIWENLGFGVAVVNADGICEYMNTIQRRVDGFSRIHVEGQHITSLYLPYELTRIPTMECLEDGKPLLKKSYYYKTTNNYLASTVSDFIPLFRRGKKDGVIAFTLWTGTTSVANRARGCAGTARSSGKNTDCYTFDCLVGDDPALREVLDEARTAAATPSPVMIWGESGTGKEVFAQAIHSESERRSKSLVPVNCAAIPENLLEGILFGTAKGAYTDAPDKPGLFEEADGGTLLLDELNSMPLGLQAKLLRVLQEKRVRRLGSHSEIPVDVRVISILNEDPFTAIQNGLLRRDLFYRLAVVGIAVPPLRERKSDIQLLARTFIGRSSLPASGKPVVLSDDVLHMLQDYDWPGNIRELLHVIEGSLALLGERPAIERDCLPRHFRDAYRTGVSISGPTPGGAQQPQPAPAPEPEPAFFDYSTVKKSSVIPLKACVQEYETQCIRNVLRLTGGNVAKAARIFQITGAGLRYKMRQLGIEDEE